MKSLLAEFLGTFALVFAGTGAIVINEVSGGTIGSKNKQAFAGIAIGSVVALEALFSGPISGASMNPARSLGPALVSDHSNHLWLVSKEARTSCPPRSKSWRRCLEVPT